MCTDGKTWVIPLLMFSSLSVCRAPHAEREPKCDWHMSFQGASFCQLPWMIRVYFLSNILPLLSPPALSFLAFTNHLLPDSCRGKHAIPPPLCNELRNPGGCWQDGSQNIWAQTAAISHNLSWRKCFTTKGREWNTENHIYISTVTLRKREKKSILMKMVL